jgi:hypothetical protein
MAETDLGSKEPRSSNMRALLKSYREYADVLSAFASSARYSFQPAGSALACRHADGRWIHGPEDPWVSAREEAAQIVTDDAQLYVLLRPGLGYLGFALLELIEKRAPNSFIVAVEDRLDLFAEVLSMFDWTPLIDSVSVEILLGEPNAVVRSFFERHPAISLLPMTLVADDETATELNGTGFVERIKTAAATLRAGVETELSVTDDVLRSRRSRKEPPRVLLAGNEFGYLTEPIAAGFRTCEASVEIRTGAAGTARGLRIHDWLRDISLLSPDVVVWMNRPELSATGCQVLRALDVTQVLWSVDNPRRMRLGSASGGGVDLFLTFDASYVDAAESVGASSVSQLSLAAGLRPLPSILPSAAQWPARLGPDISFVGSLGESRVKDFRDLLRRQNPELLALLDRLAVEEADPAVAYERATGEQFEGAPCFYVQEIRSQRRRIHVLSNLPEQSLRIFGGFDWAAAEIGVASRHAGRPPRYGFELASIYYHSRINMNVFHDQCVDSTNSRVYDVLVAGGFLLTEYRPQLEREFEIGKHLVTFSTPGEAREKAVYYLEHPVEREAIAREGQRHTLERHTFASRCRRILELVSQKAEA